jgi:hypothetical protein
MDLMYYHMNLVDDKYTIEATIALGIFLTRETQYSLFSFKVYRLMIQNIKR